MKQLSLLNWIVGAVGEAIIILCFFMFFANLPDEIFWLDLVVTSVAYALVYFRAVRPMVNLDDRAQREVPIIGLSFAATGFYAGAAILAMIVMQLAEVEFKYQILIQILLAFFLLLSFMVGARVSTNTVEVFNHEQKLQVELDRLRREVRHLDRTIAMTPGIPGLVKGRVGEFSSQLRYMSPSNSIEAGDLDREMIEKVKRINSLCSDYEANAEAIDRALSEIMHIAAERKSIYSN